MKYDLFISDYDGTLGEAPKNDIDKETISAINEYIKKGGIFIVCSGREFRSIRKICIEQGLKGLVVSFQGARIHDIETGERIMSGGLGAEFALKALDEVQPYGFTPMVYTEESFYFEEGDQSEYIEIYEHAVAMKGKRTNLKELIVKLGSVCKLGWLGEVKAVGESVDKLNALHNGKDIKYNSGAPFLLEAVNPEYTKGNAVRFIADYYKVPLEKVIAVGDSTNDIDLIVGEWHGVAVGDGKDALKAVAKEITVPFNQKPIKTLLEKYCL